MAKKEPLYPHVPKSRSHTSSLSTEYQIPITLTVRAEDEGGVISLVRQLERRAGWKPELPIKFTRIGIGEIKQI